MRKYAVEKNIEMWIKVEGQKLDAKSNICIMSDHNVFWRNTEFSVEYYNIPNHNPLNSFLI